MDRSQPQRKEAERRQRDPASPSRVLRIQWRRSQQAQLPGKPQRLCHWPCSCYPNHALGQVQDWMNETYPMWAAAHGIMIVSPVHRYHSSSVLKLMIDRLDFARAFMRSSSWRDIPASAADPR
ncbi:MAG TPA: NAD(P)H-dependent oxidoreductase [Xanthobacteraceae bacterium]|nr:NAD(P)H-dependent oxidoreductase [Xanthobacteraceae bacterium]